MGFPNSIVNAAVSADSSGSITIPGTTAGNLLLVVVGFSGSASLDIDSLTEVVSNTPSIWYCVLTTGGAATVSFAAGGPGAWVFEIACPESDWTLLDQQSATGVITANNEFTLSPFGALESMASLTGSVFNCVYVLALHGSAVIPSGGNTLKPVIYPATGWTVHPDVFGSDRSDATSVCLLLNATGVQQFQLWLSDEPIALVEHESIGAVFGPPS
jgi:hypothetical protein